MICRDKHFPQVSLECTVWYIHDARKRETSIIHYKFSSSGSFSEFKGTGLIIYQGENIINGSCAGVLYYNGEFGSEYHSEELNKAFSFSIDDVEE